MAAASVQSDSNLFQRVSHSVPSVAVSMAISVVGANESSAARPRQGRVAQPLRHHRHLRRSARHVRVCGANCAAQRIVRQLHRLTECHHRDRCDSIATAAEAQRRSQLGARISPSSLPARQAPDVMNRHERGHIRIAHSKNAIGLGARRQHASHKFRAGDAHRRGQAPRCLIAPRNRSARAQAERISSGNVAIISA